MIVTKLEYQKNDPDRVSVYVDDKFVAGINVNDVLKLNLYKGKEISTEELQKILGESEFGKLFNLALNFLSYRPRSEWEVRQHLIAKIKSQIAKSKKNLINSQISLNTQTSNIALIDQVVEKLKQIGQVDDVVFIRWFLDQRQTFKPKGKLALVSELAQKGIDRKIIDKVFSSLKDNSEESFSEFSLALKAAEKRMRNVDVKSLNSELKLVKKAQLTRFLLSRGFAFDLAKEVVDKIFKKE